MFRGCGRGGLLPWLVYSIACFLCAAVVGVVVGSCRRGGCCFSKSDRSVHVIMHTEAHWKKRGSTCNCAFALRLVFLTGEDSATMQTCRLGFYLLSKRRRLLSHGQHSRRRKKPVFFPPPPYVSSLQRHAHSNRIVPPATTSAAVYETS